VVVAKGKTPQKFKNFTHSQCKCKFCTGVCNGLL